MNKCIELIERWKEVRAKVAPSGVSSIRGVYNVVDSRDIILLGELEKKLGEECWVELDADTMSRINSDRWLQDLREGNNPRVYGSS